MTVFVPQVPHRLNRDTGELVPLDLSAAEDYGDLKVLLSPSANPLNSMGKIVDDLHAGLAEASDGDYLLLVGNPAIIGACTSVALEYTDGKISLLQWHGRDRKYNKIELNVN